jgi:anti-anti-sigma factor
MSTLWAEGVAVSELQPSSNVSVELPHGRRSRWAAVVVLTGEHDLGTEHLLQDALEPLFGNVLVDLTECTFIDSTVIGVLVNASRRCGRDGHRLELVVPVANATLTRTLEVAGVRTVLSVLEARPDDAASAAGADHDGAGHDGAGHDGADHDGADPFGADHDGAGHDAVARVGDVVRTRLGRVGTVREVYVDGDGGSAYVVIHGASGGSGDYDLAELTVVPDADGD